MRRSTVRLAGVLLLSAWLGAGCGGGSGGGGGATVITGNVRSVSMAAAATRFERVWRIVRAWWRSDAMAQVPGITVALVGAGVSTVTDEQGFFRLSVSQFGPSAVQFTGNGADAVLPLTLPAGGEVDLIDVDVTGSRVEVGEQRIQMTGPMTGIDCGARLLQVLSGTQVPFRVHLPANASIVDQDGSPLRCVDLVIGRSADVAGTVRDDGDVDAVSLRQNPPPSGSSQTTSLTGVIASTSCPTGVVVAGAQGNVEVSLSASTAIRGGDGQALSCNDLAAGDSVEVEGESTGFGVAATRIVRSAPAAVPTPTPAAG